MAKERQDAYDHTSKVAGGANERMPSTEHRDSARGDTPHPNEIRTEERAEGDGYGPRTHEQTRTVRRDEA